MRRARPGIAKLHMRSVPVQQIMLHKLMREPSPAEIEATRALLHPPLIDRFSRWVRSIGARLMHFRLRRKGRA